MCPAEDDADSAGDSLQDFISKLQALEASNEVGDWNKKIAIDNKTGQKFVAIYAANAWKMVDLRYKPATYNEKSLKVLIEKAGGRTNGVTLEFAADKAQVITYHNAKITPRLDASGNPILPNKPSTTNRKAWLIPIALWGESDTDNGYTDGAPSSGDAPSSGYLDDTEIAAATTATDRYQTSVAAETFVESSISALQITTATTATIFKEQERKETNSFEEGDRTTVPNTRTTVSEQLVAASNPIPVGTPAATTVSVAANQPKNLPQLARQILLCTTWVEIAEEVGENASLLWAAAKTMTQEQRQGLTRLLIAQLCSAPAYLEQLAWVPEMLRQRALLQVRFTIWRIKAASGDALDGCIDYIRGCKFISESGHRWDQWLFELPDGSIIPIFGATSIEAVYALATN